MIIGIGNDIVEIDRIRRILAGSSGKRFMERVLTPAEVLIAKSRPKKQAQFIAGRFVIKESIVKALGTGLGGTVGLQDMEILPDSFGKPECQISSEAFQRLQLNRDSIRVHLSITHSEQMAAGFAVIETL